MKQQYAKLFAGVSQMRFDTALFRLDKGRDRDPLQVDGSAKRSLLAICGGCLMAVVLSPVGLALAQDATQDGGLEIGVEVKAGPSSGPSESSGNTVKPPPVTMLAPPPAAPVPSRSEQTAPSHVIHDKAVSDMVSSLESSRQSALKDYSGGMSGENMFDPFLPIAAITSETDPNALQITAEANLPPLQRMELNQIRLVAVVVAEGGGRTALVEDSAGIGYIVQIGTPMGRKSGHVVAIHGDHLEVEEKVKNFMGEDKSRITAIKLYQVEGAR